jgi:hypothetical protein
MDEKTIEQIIASERIDKEIDSQIEAIDEVRIHFDWRPAVKDGRIIFQAGVIRGEKHSSISFEVDLGKLSEVELEQLRDFLTRRHAGLTTAYETTRAITWLLDRSVAQAQPRLSDHDRQIKVHELLLFHQLP